MVVVGGMGRDTVFIISMMQTQDLGSFVFFFYLFAFNQRLCGICQGKVSKSYGLVGSFLLVLQNNEGAMFPCIWGCLAVHK